MIRYKPNLLRFTVLAAFALVVLAGCKGNAGAPIPTPAAVVAPPFSTDAAVPDAATAAVDKTKGGTISLNDGAEATFPPDALVNDATVTLRTASEPSAVPVPWSIAGQAYELEIDGSELTGVVSLRLPLPPGVTSDQYDLAPYRWNGRLWERVTGRDVTGGVQIGVGKPGTYALLGRWRLADASLALIKPDILPGQQSIPLTVVGQYRYSAIPALQDGLAPAHLLLKRDTSGGAGLVAGDPNQDQTVDEMTLYFKPDPARSDGLIQFQHVFDLTPGTLDVDPGVHSRFYVVLNVEDAATPTRRISTGVDYTQNLPIQIQGMQVIRPIILHEDRVRLRWKISLNNLTFQTPEARTATLELQPIIDKGGVGDYKVVLEVEQEGQWAPVSNELSVQLAVRPTVIPLSAPTATPALVAITTPIAIPSPAVPTRRPTPRPSDASQARITSTPTITPTAATTGTPTATPWDWANLFRADRYTIASGECTNLHWDVENVVAVRFNGQGATGKETRRECPKETTTYSLSVTSSTGTQEYVVTIHVVPAGQPDVVFTADQMQIAPNGCTILRWSVTGVREVRLNGEAVDGVSFRKECLNQTATFTLTVLTTAGETVSRALTIAVSDATATPTGGPDNAAFWADGYALPDGGCTTLHWRVQNVRSVHLDGEGKTGIGTQPNTCPPRSPNSYTLQITDTSGAVTTRQITLTTGDPGLAPNEVIARGIVRQSAQRNDIRPNEAGDQPGYSVTIEGAQAVYSGSSGLIGSAITLQITQQAIDSKGTSQLHWPVRPSQPVEFRAVCESGVCYLDEGGASYLYWRGE